MNRLSLLFVFIILAPGFRAQSQADTSQSFSVSMRQAEDSLRFYLDSIRTSKTDQRKLAWNSRFKKCLEKTLDSPEAFNYPFDSLKTLGKLESPDQVFRLFNWNVEKSDFTQSYFAFILLPQNKKNKVIELKDMSPGISDPENQVCDVRKWYGCLYYEIILSKKEGKKEYTLLGFDMNDKATKKRIIESMNISGDKIQFGLPVFTMLDEEDPKKKKTKRRIILEYSSEVQMVLKYHPKEKRIVFDHLSPIDSKAKGIRQYYVPDGSYDALLLDESGRWEHQQDVDVRGKKTPKYNDPRN